LKEYPHTSKEFKVNNKIFVMKKLTLGLQAKIEDENITVTYKDVLLNATSMKEEDIQELDGDQFEAIYNDIALFTYSDSGDGDEPKKP
jgi:hypothetical protein